MAMIAVMSDLSLRIVERTCAAKNAKGCLAISWRASLSANTAEIVQEQLAGISAGKVLYANNGEYRSRKKTSCGKSILFDAFKVPVNRALSECLRHLR